MWNKTETKTVCKTYNGIDGDTNCDLILHSLQLHIQYGE